MYTLFFMLHFFMICRLYSQIIDLVRHIVHIVPCLDAFYHFSVFLLGASLPVSQVVSQDYFLLLDVI